MTSVEIIKGMPMPNTFGRKQKYPWMKMEIGDAFEIGQTKGNGYRAAHLASKRYAPRKFTARFSDGKMRIWRVE